MNLTLAEFDIVIVGPGSIMPISITLTAHMHYISQ